MSEQLVERIGVITSALDIQDPVHAYNKAGEMGFYNVHFVFDPDKRQDTIERLQDSIKDLPKICAIAMRNSSQPWLDYVKPFFDFAAELGVPLVTGHTPKLIKRDAEEVYCVIRKSVEYGANKGVQFGYETGKDEVSIVENLLINIDSLTLCYDAANLMYYGASERDVLALLEGNVDRVALVHIKDVKIGNHPEFVTLGKGDFPLDEILSILFARGYNGLFVHESGLPIGERLRSIQESKAYFEQHLQTVS